MANFRGVILLQHDVYGWSEYYGVEDVDAPTALIKVRNIMNLRAALCLAEVSLTCAVHELGAPRNALYGISTPGVYAPGGDIHTLVPSVCLEVTKVCAEAPNGRLFMRGLPEDQVIGDTLVPLVGWQTAYDAWKGSLIGGDYYVIKRIADPVVHYELRDIVASTRNNRLATRRVGRPFFLPRGRRLVV